MIRRIALSAAIALAVATPSLIVPATAHAAFFRSGSGAKVKNVKMTLKNRTSAPMNLMVEDKPITIAPNAEYALNAPEGTKVYDSNKEVKVTVTRDLEGTTCSFN